MKLKAMAFEWNDTFINGNEVTVDEDEFNGLKYRVGQFPERQRIYTDASGDGTGAALLVLSTAATQHQLLDALHEASHNVGGADAFFMNEKTYLYLSSILRRQSLLDTTQDSFDRAINSFLGAPLIDVGLKADGSTEIITNTETDASGNDATSIYAVKFGLDEGLVGLQLDNLDAYVVTEELDSKPAKRIRIDWANGLATLGDYCICRIMGFEMAAV
jgi:hypothetical protein